MKHELKINDKFYLGKDCAHTFNAYLRFKGVLAGLFGRSNFIFFTLYVYEWSRHVPNHNKTWTTVRETRPSESTPAYVHMSHTYLVIKKAQYENYGPWLFVNFVTTIQKSYDDCIIFHYTAITTETFCLIPGGISYIISIGCKNLNDDQATNNYIMFSNA